MDNLKNYESIVSPSVITQVLYDLKGDSNWSDLAAVSGIDKSLISAVRSGHRRLTPKIAQSIAEGLNISVGDFYEKLALVAINTERTKLLSKYSNSIYAGSEFFDFVENSLSNLQEGDHYINVSAEPSIEFQSTQAHFVRPILEAIRRGVTFSYIIPKRHKPLDIGEGYGDDEIYDLNAIVWSSVLDPENKFMVWKRLLIQSFPQFKDEISQFIHCKTLDIETKGHFFAPYIRFMLVLRKLEIDDEIILSKKYDKEAWVEISATQSLERSYLQLNESATDTLYQYCDKILNI